MKAVLKGSTTPKAPASAKRDRKTDASVKIPEAEKRTVEIYRATRNALGAKITRQAAYREILEGRYAAAKKLADEQRAEAAKREQQPLQIEAARDDVEEIVLFMSSLRDFARNVLSDEYATIVRVIAERCGALADRAVERLGGGPGLLGSFEEWADREPERAEERGAA